MSVRAAVAATVGRYWCLPFPAGSSLTRTGLLQVTPPSLDRAKKTSQSPFRLSCQPAYAVSPERAREGKGGMYGRNRSGGTMSSFTTLSEKADVPLERA